DVRTLEHVPEVGVDGFEAVLALGAVGVLPDRVADRFEGQLGPHLGHPLQVADRGERDHASAEDSDLHQGRSLSSRYSLASPGMTCSANTRTGSTSFQSGMRKITYWQPARA